MNEPSNPQQSGLVYHRRLTFASEQRAGLRNIDLIAASALERYVLP